MRAIIVNKYMFQYRTDDFRISRCEIVSSINKMFDYNISAHWSFEFKRNVFFSYLQSQRYETHSANQHTNVEIGDS